MRQRQVPTVDARAARTRSGIFAIKLRRLSEINFLLTLVQGIGLNSLFAHAQTKDKHGLGQGQRPRR